MGMSAINARYGCLQMFYEQYGRLNMVTDDEDFEGEEYEEDPEEDLEDNDEE